jgi:hypothetical protein
VTLGRDKRPFGPTLAFRSCSGSIIDPASGDEFWNSTVYFEAPQHVPVHTASLGILLNLFNLIQPPLLAHQLLQVQAYMAAHGS